MFVSPRFRDFFGTGPIRARRRERPGLSERTSPAAHELDEIFSNAEEILLEFAEAHLRALRAQGEFVPAQACKPEFIPAPAWKAEFIPAPVCEPEFVPASLDPPIPGPNAAVADRGTPGSGAAKS